MCIVDVWCAHTNNFDFEVTTLVKKAMDITNAIGAMIASAKRLSG